MSCLQKLLDKVGFCSKDFLFIIGDVVDRNEDGGVQILKWLMLQPNVQLLLGNHEDFLLMNKWIFSEVTSDNVDDLDSRKLSYLANWQWNGGDVTIEALRKESPEVRADIIDYLEDCPLYETLTAGGKRYVLVHGGLGNFSKDKPLEEYTVNELLWERPSFSKRYDPENYTVIVGHTPTFAFSMKNMNRMIKSDCGWWDIDTGAAAETGRPMLLCLDNLKEYYIEENGDITVI